MTLVATIAVAVPEAAVATATGAAVFAVQDLVDPVRCGQARGGHFPQDGKDDDRADDGIRQDLVRVAHGRDRYANNGARA